ncbi:MAG: hypothetical protein ACK5P7_07635 [Bdellovibrio sp.]|jgi:hypothetical protein
MKRILSLVLLTAAFSAQAADIKISRDCGQKIQISLAKQNLTITRIIQASFFPGGSDGASSWENEYSIQAVVKNSEGVSARVFIDIDDNINCRVLRVRKIF